MAAQIHDLGRALMAYMVAFAAGVQTLAQFVLNMVRAEWLDAVVWGLATTSLMMLAASIESIKRFLGE